MGEPKFEFTISDNPLHETGKVGMLIVDDTEEIITVESFTEYVSGHGLPSDVAEYVPLGGGLVQWTFYPERIEDADYWGIEHDTPVSVPIGGGAAVLMDRPFFSLYKEGDEITDALALTSYPDRVINAKTVPTAISAYWEEDGLEVDDMKSVYAVDRQGKESELWKLGIELDNAFRIVGEETGEKLTIMHLFLSLLTLQTGIGLAREIARRSGKGALAEYTRGENTIFAAADPVNGAIFDKARSDHITAQEIWNGEPKRINAPKGGTIDVTVKPYKGAEISINHSDVDLNAKDQFWLDALGTLARGGHREVRGTQILSKYGFANPYSPSVAKTLKEAADTYRRFSTTLIAYDATDAYKHKAINGLELHRRIDLEPLLKLDKLSLESYGEDGEVKDFVLTLGGETPIDALPTQRFSHVIGATIPLLIDWSTFAGLRPTLLHRQAIAYLYRRVYKQGTNDTILFDSLFKALDMPGDSVAQKRKRERLLDALEKMLDRMTGRRKNADGSPVYPKVFESWKWHKNKGKRDGFTIQKLSKAQDGK